MFLLALLLFFAHSAFADPVGIHCAKVSTLTEQHICSNEQLTLLDVAITQRYQALLHYLPEDQKNPLKQQQLRWLKIRVYQKKDDDFLALMQNREAQLTNKISQIILPKLNLISIEPEKVAELLQQFPTALSQAWLAFIYAGDYLTGRNPQEILEANRPNIVLANDPLLSQIYDENAKELTKSSDHRKRMDLVILEIRMAYDAETNFELQTALRYPCFIKQAYPDDYSSLFFYWGSSRDAQAPTDDCEINDPYSALPAYAKFSELVGKMDAKQGDQDMRAMLPGDPNAGDPSYVFGTIRFSIENTVLSDSHDIHNALLTATPKQLAKLNTKDAKRYLATFAKNKTLALEYAEFRVVQNQFEQQIASVLMEKFMLNSTDAQNLAKMISLKLLETNCTKLRFNASYSDFNKSQ